MKANKKRVFLLSVVAILIVIITIAVLINSTEDKDFESSISQQEWSTIDYEAREKWINSYMDNPDDHGYALIATTIDAIKDQFEYPKSVKFYNSPSFDRAVRNIVEADSGWVFSYGKGTVKDAFGLESEFTYSVKWEITPITLKILELSIN